MKKLSSYLSAGIAATATFQSTDAATVVTFYGSGARNPTSSPATPNGLELSVYKSIYTGVLYQNIRGSGGVYMALTGLTYNIFTSGANIKAAFAAGSSSYFLGNTKEFTAGAQSGSANYANISFNGNDSVYEAVGQFHLDGLGGGYLIALARNDDNSALFISDGKLAIDAVPEPSAIALLALGAGGMAMRRRRKVA
jgi:PEP-CTERM motif